MSVYQNQMVPIGQTIAEIWPFFSFWKCRPAVILHLLYACLDHPRSTVGGRYRYAKFVSNRHCIVLNICDFQCYASLAWKNLFTPLLGCFWGKLGKMETFCSF